MQFTQVFSSSIAAGMDVPAARCGRSQYRSNTAGAAGFGKVFEMALSRAQNRPGISRTDRIGRSEPSGISSEERLNRPQDLTCKRIRRETLSETRNGKKAEAADMDGGFREEVNRRTGFSDMLEVLAQLTGLDRTMLKEILASLGIPEDVLSARAGFAETAARLSELLGPDAEQKDALAELMRLIGDAVGLHDTADTAAGAGEVLPGGNTQAGLVRDAAGFEEAVRDALESAPEISGRIRAGILGKPDEFAAGLAADGDVADEGVRNAVTGLPGKAQAARSNAPGDGTGTTAEAVQPGDEAVPADSRVEAAMEGSGTDGTDPEAGDGSVQKPALHQDTEAMHEREMTDAGMAAVQQNSHGPDAVTQTAAGRQADQPVSARQIISQVAEKVSVILERGKSEMVIELKPDSLGRLSLKVVAENGTVMAKFTADNLQVQRLLESNMQMLRESLERQGIVVQDLSVSVRQDGGQARENGPQNRGLPGLRPKGFAPTAAVGMPDVSWTAEATGINDPWMWQGSTINLTA